MYRLLLVPLDGSAFSEAALPVATEIARKSGGSIELVAVQEALMSMAYQEWVDGEGPWEARYLNEVTARAGADTEVKMSSTVETGAVHDAIRDRAEEIGADLVVMATHGRGALTRAWLGSVADALVRHTNVPVLLVRPEEDEEGEEPPPATPPEFGRIMVPLDGSDLAESVLEQAARLGQLFGSRLILIRVVAYPSGLASPYLPDTVSLNQQVLDQAKETADNYLKTVAKRMAERGLETDTLVVVDAHPAAGILEAAQEVEPDLVAMATHGRGGVSRALLGSVTDKVMRASHTPVLLVHPGG